MSDQKADGPCRRLPALRGVIAEAEAAAGRYAGSRHLVDCLAGLSAEARTARDAGATSLEAADRCIARFARLREQLRLYERLIAGRATLGKQAPAAAVEDLAPPPWRDGRAARAAELEVALIFAEGDRLLGGGRHRAERVAEVAGAGGAWWIARQTDDPTDSGRCYLFKPSSAEPHEYHGVPRQGLAVREILAKRLSDAMAGGGFQIGVCPTYLVRLESDRLTGLSVEEARTTSLGSLQELAPNDGAILGLFDRADLIARIDPKAYGDIAVFDMILSHLDRHGRNLLIRHDPVARTIGLVPIDHGHILASREGEKLARFRRSARPNCLLDPAMVLQNRKLDPETRANLQRLDPASLVAGLRGDLQAIACRHPEVAGKLDPAPWTTWRPDWSFCRRPPSN